MGKRVISAAAIVYIILIATTAHCFGPMQGCSEKTSTPSGQCNSATDYIGFPSATPTTAGALSSEFLYAQLTTPTCASGCTSGTFGIGYAWHSSTATDAVKVCAYLSDGDATPDGGDTLIGCQEATSSTNGAFAATGSSIGGAVNCSASYWLVLISNGTTFDSSYQSTGFYYRTGATVSGAYTSPPATLLAFETSPINGVRRYVAYIEVGP